MAISGFQDVSGFDIAAIAEVSAAGEIRVPSIVYRIVPEQIFQIGRSMIANDRSDVRFPNVQGTLLW